MLPIVERARALQPLILGDGDAIESARQLTDPVVEAILQARLFDMNIPAAIGGPEVDARTYLETIEAVSAADGSTGWCVMISAETNGIMASRLENDIARRVFMDDGPIATAASAVPAGDTQITRREDAYQINGRWRFASGCNHAAYLGVIGSVVEDGTPVVSSGGQPRTVFASVPRELVEIVDVWRVAGLRGTGSNDLALHDASIPAELVVDLGDIRHPTPMMRFPSGAFLAMSKAAVATGIARGAIDAFIDLAEKVPWMSGTPLREEVRSQLQVAEAEPPWQSARGFLFDAVAQAWATVMDGGPASEKETAMVRLASVHAAVSSARAVELMHHAAGTSSLFETSPLQRAFRDVHAVRQHANVADRFREDAGRVLLGLAPQEAIF